MIGGRLLTLPIPVIALFVAGARVLEERIRTSRRVRKHARRAMVLLTRVSSEARAFVRVRLMPIV